MNLPHDILHFLNTRVMENRFKVSIESFAPPFEPSLGWEFYHDYIKFNSFDALCISGLGWTCEVRFHSPYYI